jgi:hypothetical protein
MAGPSYAKVAIRLKQLLHDLGFPQNSPIHIYRENQLSISLAKNLDIFHDRSIFIDLQYNFFKKKLKQRKLFWNLFSLKK